VNPACIGAIQNKRFDLICAAWPVTAVTVFVHFLYFLSPLIG